MKKNVFTLIALILLVLTSCQNKIDAEKEKAAIIAVIEEVTEAFYDRDYERLVACHVRDESNIRLTASKRGFDYTVGWQDSGLKKFIENDPDLDLSKEVKSNFNIKVYQESAWAVYDNEHYSEDGELVNKGIHAQFLEKHEGDWKIVYFSIVSTGSYLNAENNLKTAATYHKFDPEDINDILTDDFIGRNEKSRFTWNKENHQNYWSNNPRTATDTIFHQIADGNWVATRFQRKMNWQGKDVEFESMHFKRFENGKIAEIWEYGDTKQAD
jgi:hypothetical protein